MSSEQRRLTELDHQYIWHPFTQQKHWTESEQPLIVESAEGFDLIDVEGKRYLDGVSSLWCNVHGHSEPELMAALHDQADKLCHSTLLGLTHRPVIELSEKLFKILPEGLSKVFYADAGTTAVEAGLRIALEWWQKQSGEAAKKKRKLLSLDGAYHGDTVGSVTIGFLPAFHGSIEPILVPALRTPPPHMFRFYDGMSEEDALAAALEQLEQTLLREADSIAAFFMEPLVQGAAGIWVQPPEFLRVARELCRKHNVLFLADEVATGFGKTGSLFAVEQGPVSPDIMIIGKGLSAGYLPISAAICSQELYDGFLGGVEEGKTFFYGQTFAGNPLAARVAAANLDLLEQRNVLGGLPERIAAISKALDENIQPLDCVDEVRQCGLMVGIELTKKPGERCPYPAQELAGWRVIYEARKRGVVIRPLGNVIILMPAITMPAQQIERLVQVTADSLRDVLES